MDDKELTIRIEDRETGKVAYITVSIEEFEMLRSAYLQSAELQESERESAIVFDEDKSIH